jgi:lipopolysaccharide assembly protein A
MSFLKTLLWVIVLVGFVVFAVNNWQPISIRLWGGLWLDTKLPALLAVSFLLGYVPLYLWHKTQKFRLSRKIATLESSARPAPLDLGQTRVETPTAGGAV